MIVIWFVNYGANLFWDPYSISVGDGFVMVFGESSSILLLNSLPEVIYQNIFILEKRSDTVLSL